MIGKLFKGKDNKTGNYFLELDDAEGSTAEAPATTEAQAEVAPEVVATEAAEAPATEEAAPAAKAKGKSKVKAKGKAKAAPSVTVSAPTPVAKPKSAEPVIANFATDYLLPTPTKIRRTPGGSMSNFLEMARQVGR